MQNASSPENSVPLGELISAKRNRGQHAESLVLERLIARIAAQEESGTNHAELSRKALERYLELMPHDSEVQQALAHFPRPARPTGNNRMRWIFWMLFITCGISTASAIYFNGFPLPVEAPPVNLSSIRIPLHPRPAQASAADLRPIVIRAVGDVVLGSDSPVYRLPGPDEKKRIAALRNTLRSADIVVGNMAGVLYDSGKSPKDTTRPGWFTFRMPVSYAAVLREMGFDVMSLANNHSMDFGEAGFQSTVQALNAQGIQLMGVPGAEVAILKVRDTRVAFLNYSYLPAFARMDDEQRVKRDIEQARQVADLIVISVHAGKEGASAAGAPVGDEYFMHEYRGNLRKFAQLAIDSGACVVFAHGAHVVRPYEVYKDQPVFFSLGNFVGYHSLSTRGKLSSSIIAEVRLSPKGKLLGAGIIPLKMDRSGIPAPDYSIATLNALDGLLDGQLEKRPVLQLAAHSAVIEAPAMQHAPQKPEGKL